jgi:dienelactone hydrolase
MNIMSVLPGFLLLFAALGDASSACADELVQITAHRAAVSPGSSEVTPPLLGFLTRPAGPGRFPAVVLLHSCGGFSGHDTDAASTLKSWGYVALAIDSLGGSNMCWKGGGTAAEALDAYAGLRYLATQNFVASSRIAVMGFSMGGLAALVAVEKGLIWPATQARFAAAVAYYPQCEYASGVMTAPALILAGELDDWNVAEACRKLAAHESDIGITRSTEMVTPVELVVYLGATHAFDMRRPPSRDRGHLEQYNEVAARDAALRTLGFLRDVLGDQPDNP